MKVVNFYSLMVYCCLPFLVWTQHTHHPNPSKEEDLHRQFFEAKVVGKDSLIIQYAQRLGMQKIVENELDSALHYLNIGVERAIVQNDAITLNNLREAKTRVLLSQSEWRAAIQILYQLIQAEKQSNNRQAMGEFYAVLGNTFRNLGQYDSCTHYLALAKEVAPNPNANFIHKNLAALYRDIGDYDKAIDLQIQMLEAHEADDNQLVVFHDLIDLSETLMEQQAFEKAAIYAQRALDLANQLDLTIYKGRILHLLGRILLNQEEENRATTYLDQALSIFKENQRDLEIADVLVTLGKIEQQRNNFATAEDRFNQAAQYYHQSKEKSEWINITFALANVKLATHRAREALQDLDKVTTFVEKAADLQNKRTLYDLLSKAYAQTQQLSLAYEYLIRNIQVNEKIYNVERNRTASELEVKYQLQAKERDLQALQQTAALRNTQLRLQRYYIFGLIIGLIFLLGLVVFFQRNSRKNKLIAQQKLALGNHQIQQLQQEKRLIALQSVIEGQEQERQRIAHDLHDGLGALLSTVRLQFDSVQTDSLPQKEQQQFHKSKTLLATASRETRDIAHNMMPSSIHRFGLIAALKDACDAITHAQGITVNFQALNFEIELSKNKQVAIFRIVQELLNNSIKHALATEILVQISTHEHQLEIIVEDDGKGFNTDQLKVSNGIGLSSVQSRVDYLEATLLIESEMESGTTFIVIVPMN